MAAAKELAPVASAARCLLEALSGFVRDACFEIAGVNVATSLSGTSTGASTTLGCGVDAAAHNFDAIGFGALVVVARLLVRIERNLPFTAAGFEAQWFAVRDRFGNGSSRCRRWSRGRNNR